MSYLWNYRTLLVVVQALQKEVFTRAEKEPFPEEKNKRYREDDVKAGDRVATSDGGEPRHRSNTTRGEATPMPRLWL